jgi:hypothetical protein
MMIVGIGQLALVLGVFLLVLWVWQQERRIDALEDAGPEIQIERVSDADLLAAIKAFQDSFDATPDVPAGLARVDLTALEAMRELAAARGLNVAQASPADLGRRQ